MKTKLILDKATLQKQAKKMIEADMEDVKSGKYSIAFTQEPRSTVGKLMHWLGEYIQFLSIYDVPVDNQIKMIRKWTSWRYDMVRSTYIKHLKDILGEDQYELYLRRIWLCKRYKTISDGYVLMEEQGEAAMEQFLIERHIIGNMKNKFGSKTITFTFDDIKAFIRIYQDRGLFRRKANGDTFSYEDFKKTHARFVAGALDSVEREHLGTAAEKERDHVNEVFAKPIVKENALEVEIAQAKKRAFKSVKALYDDSNATREAKRDAMRRGIEFDHDSFRDLTDPEMTDEEYEALRRKFLIATVPTGPAGGRELLVNLDGRYDHYIESGHYEPDMPPREPKKSETDSEDEAPKRTAKKPSTSPRGDQAVVMPEGNAPRSPSASAGYLEARSRGLVYEPDRVYDSEGLDSVKLRHDNNTIADEFWAFYRLAEADAEPFNTQIPVGALLVTCDPEMYSSYRKIGEKEYRFIADLHPHPLMQMDFEKRERQINPTEMDKIMMRVKADNLRKEAKGS